MPRFAGCRKRKVSQVRVRNEELKIEAEGISYADILAAMGFNQLAVQKSDARTRAHSKSFAKQK
jgi:hypothetical protein